MLVVPVELTRIRIERERRARVQRAVQRTVVTTNRHPRLGLGNAPVRPVQHGIVRARDPRLPARAIEIRQIAPGVAAGCEITSNRVEAPRLCARLGVVGADEALFFLIRLTIRESRDHFAVNDNRPARKRVEIVLGAVTNHGIPGERAGRRIECNDARIVRRHVDLIAVNREPAVAARGNVRAEIVLPDQIASYSI